jgi:hypothetical protein
MRLGILIRYVQEVGAGSSELTMGLEDEARRAAEEADGRARAGDNEVHERLVRHGTAQMQAAVKEWADGIPVENYRLGRISFEAAHDSDYGTAPNHPDRLAADLTCGDVRLRAYFNLEETSFRWAGSTHTTHGLHVYLDRYHGGAPIDIRTKPDLGRALRASDVARQSTEPASEYFGISVSKSVEKAGLAILVLVVLALIFLALVSR